MGLPAGTPRPPPLYVIHRTDTVKHRTDTVKHRSTPYDTVRHRTPYLPTAVGCGCGSRPPGGIANCHCRWQAMSRPAGMGSGGDFRSPISTRACACSCAAPRQLPVLLPLPHCASLPFREPRLTVSVPHTLKATSPLAAAAAAPTGAVARFGAGSSEQMAPPRGISSSPAPAPPWCWRPQVFWFHQIKALRPVSATKASLPWACSSLTTLGGS